MDPGIHLLHKPVGPTSFSIVQECLRHTSAPPGRRRPRVCHGGTLDPFACGLLLILVDPATQLFSHLHAIPKVYEATVRWGVETENGDPLGRVIHTGDTSSLSVQQLDDALQKFVGWHDQTPHATSARRIDGERAYLKAHRGEVVNMPATQVYLHETKWLGHDLPRESRLGVTVRGGYYIRALARDLGRLIGCGAHLSALHRVAIGPWTDPGPGQSVHLRGRDILPWARARILSDQEVNDLQKNQLISAGDLLPPDWPIPADFPDPQAPIRGIHQERFCFLLDLEGEYLRKRTVLRGGL